MLLLPLLFFVVSVYGQGCSNYVMTDYNRQEFLNAHNSLRSQISKGQYAVQGKYLPSASNMQALTWNCNLETTAQQYANNCPTDTQTQGQNLYYAWSPTKQSVNGLGQKCTDEWASQFQKYGFSSQTYSNTYSTQYASQMCWATTTSMGCGVNTNCPSTDYQNPYKTTVVCLYNPPGNVQGQPIYNQGASCSQCPYGYYDTTTYLCNYNQPAQPQYPPQNPAPVYPPKQNPPQQFPQFPGHGNGNNGNNWNNGKGNNNNGNWNNGKGGNNGNWNNNNPLGAIIPVIKKIIGFTVVNGTSTDVN